MQQFIVTGMSCAACSARVEKAVSKVEGVTSCSVSLLTNSMGVEGTAADQAIIQAVEAAGYGASVKGEAAEHSGASSMAAEEEMLKDRLSPFPAPLPDMNWELMPESMLAPRKFTPKIVERARVNWKKHGYTDEEIEELLNQ